MLLVDGESGGRERVFDRGVGVEMDPPVVIVVVNLSCDLPPAERKIDASQTDIAAMTHLGRGSVDAALRDLQSRVFIRAGYQVRRMEASPLPEEATAN